MDTVGGPTPLRVRVLGGAEFCLKLRGLVILPLLAAQLGTDGYGVWSQVAVLVAVFFPLVGLGTSTGILRFLPSQQPPARNRFFTAWLLALLMAALLLATGLCLAQQWLAQLFFGTMEPHRSLVLLASLLLVANVLNHAVRTWFQLENSSACLAAMITVQVVLNLAAVAAVLYQNLGIHTLLLYTAAGDLGLVLVFFGIGCRRYGLARPDFMILPTVLKVGVPLLPAVYAVWGLNFMDCLFLVHYGSLSEVGIYAAACLIGATLIPVIAHPFRTVFHRGAATMYQRGDHAGLQRLFGKSVSMVWALTVPVALGLAVIAKPLLELAASPDFAAGADVVGMVALGHIFAVMASFHAVGLGLLQRPQLAAAGALIACVINFILNCVLIPHHGMHGAALATTAAFFVQLLISFVIVRATNLMETDITFVWKVLAAAAVMAFAIAGVDALLQGIGLGPAPKLLLTCVTGFAIYGALAAKLKLINTKAFGDVLTTGHHDNSPS